MAAVNAVAFTPDGRSVVSGSEDATALVWDVSDLRDTAKTVEPLNPESLQAHWNALAGNDARAAYRATWLLSVPPAVEFLSDRLKVAATAEPFTATEYCAGVRAVARPWSASAAPRPVAHRARGPRKSRRRRNAQGAARPSIS